MESDKYLPTIGLEIHAELHTETKMFCGSKNDASEKRPNSNVCPVCMAHPGTLPVINKAAVRHVLRVGVALGAELADYTEFDRKNYFYPDLPKGYQLSQFEYPLVSGGHLNGIKITRVHLEEDTASSIHDEKSGATLVDYNRAGVPLMELVTEPVIHSAEEAGDFGRELQLLLRYLGASEADMEKGQMRLEANISVAKISTATQLGSTAVVSQATGSSTAVLGDKSSTDVGNSGAANLPKAAAASEVIISKGGESLMGKSNRNSNEEKTDYSLLGTKVEVKNINSFRAMERAIQFEVKRQIALLEKGEKIVQETRGWDENKQATFSQRIKEGSADYRYFPDPDLPSLKLSEVGLTQEELRKDLPELPWQKRERLSRLGINTQDIELYVKDDLFGRFFEDVAKEFSGDSQKIAKASNYISNDLVKLISDTRDSDTRDSKILDIMPITARNFAKIINLIFSGKLSSRSAKDLLAICMDGLSDPEAVANERNLLQNSASVEIEPIVAKILADNSAVVADYKGGKAAALQYLIGQGMKELRGTANPSMLRDEIEKQIGKMA